MAVGPSRSFPFDAPIRPGDQGGLFGSIKVIKERRQVVFDFGTPISWVSLPPHAAKTYAAAIRAMVHANFGKLPYNARTLPLRVEAEQHTGLIVITMPETLNMLVVNPEVVLALAERMEVAIAKMTH